MEEPKKYTGTPISLDLKDAPLAEVFRLFADISGLNVIADPEVDDRLTLGLAEVPWDQVFDIVMKRFRLGYLLEGNVIRVAKLGTLIREEAEQRRLEQQKALAGETVRVVVRLIHASASQMHDILMRAAVTPRGYIVVDEHSNSLIITDLPSAVVHIESIVARLDVEGANRPAAGSTRGAAPSSAIVVNVQGDFMQQNISGNEGTAIQAEKFQGSAIGRLVGNRLQDSLNVVADSGAKPELKATMKELHEAVEQLLLQLPADANREDVANNLETLSRQAVERRPIRDIIKVTGDGLLEAGKAVGAAGMLLEAIRTVASVLGFPGLF